MTNGKLSCRDERPRSQRLRAAIRKLNCIRRAALLSPSAVRSRISRVAIASVGKLVT